MIDHVMNPIVFEKTGHKPSLLVLDVASTPVGAKMQESGDGILSMGCETTFLVERQPWSSSSDWNTNLRNSLVQKLQGFNLNEMSNKVPLQERIGDRWSLTAGRVGQPIGLHVQNESISAAILTREEIPRGMTARSQDNVNQFVRRL